MGDDLPPLSSLTRLAGKCPNFHPFSIAGWSQPPPCCSFARENGEYQRGSFAHHDLHSPVVFGRGTTFYKSRIYTASSRNPSRRFVTTWP